MDEKQIITQIVEKQSLDLFHIGSDKINFLILQDAKNKKGTNIDAIEKNQGLKTTSANRRVNLMLNVGLVQRKKRKVYTTDLGKQFIRLVDDIQTFLRTGLNENLIKYRIMEKKDEL